MTEISLPLTADLQQSDSVEKDLNGYQARWNCTAYFCFAVGVLAGVAGLFLSGINYFTAPEGTGAKIGTLLVFAVLPLMLFGSHALDKIAECSKAK